MFCKSCGKIVDDDSKYCVHCGTKLFSEKAPVIENNEEASGRRELSQKKPEKTSISKSINSTYNEQPARPLKNQKDVLEEFAPIEWKRKPIRKWLGIAIALPGCLILASYISFLLFSNYPVIPEINLISFLGIVWISPTFGIHLFAIFGFILLFLSSIILLKYNKIVFYKLISIGIDGLGLLLFIALFQNIFFGKSIDALKDSFDLSYFLQSDILANKIIFWSLYLLLFYFIPEISGGTIGKRIAGLISQNKENQHISLKQGFQKTIIYAFPVWIILLSFSWNPHVLNDISDSILYHFCQWACFILFFVSLFMIFISEQNHSLADFFSKTVVLRKDSPTPSSNLIALQNLSIKNPEVSNTVVNNIFNLHKLIIEEKKKIFSGSNDLIIERIEEIIKDKNSFFSIDKIYKEEYSKGILEHLMSISSGYGTIYFYMKPFIKLGICEEDFPHKIISSV
jgi:uncharacterized RDD family membrane protein YckC/RNA polymerase subunit RPABC4/transcription elongation factor Spt4